MSALHENYYVEIQNKKHIFKCPLLRQRMQQGLGLITCITPGHYSSHWHCRRRKRNMSESHSLRHTTDFLFVTRITADNNSLCVKTKMFTQYTEVCKNHESSSISVFPFLFIFIFLSYYSISCLLNQPHS